MLDCVRNLVSDSLTIQVLRWFQKFIYRYHDHSFGNSELWVQLTSRCISICKSHIFSMSSRERDSTNNINGSFSSRNKISLSKRSASTRGNSTQNRSLLWPARVAALQTL
jgi:hypothetical protein